MNNPEKDVLHRPWIAVTTLVAVLVVVSFIPPQTLDGVKLRRANIFSDLFTFDDATAAEAVAPVLFDEAEYQVDMQEVTQLIDADTARKTVQTTFSWNIPTEQAPRLDVEPPIAPLTENPVTPIEDFTDGGLRAFCDTLLHADRPVRIAFLGDSFVEGDILTADLREQLQNAYGGGGTGFAPIASPLTAFRRSVKTQSRGWNSYGIMQRKSAPESVRANFYISGWACQPASDGASTRWENSDFRPHLDSCNAARIFFISPANSRLEVVINDTERHQFTVEGDASVRQIAITAPHIHSLSFRVVTGIQGFIGYGAVFENKGVVVDNYSIRSNNGQAMFWTNPSVNAQIQAMLGYDLVVLQYGLNIMQNGVSNYTQYAEQIQKMVIYVRECFPGAAVLVMGVSDRSTRTDTGFAPMEAVTAMTAYQRQAASATGAAFWATSDAMRSWGGMSRFVQNGWAGKDYTHINYAGGRRIALSLCDALNAAAAKAYEENPFGKRTQSTSGIVDSITLEKIQRTLLPGIVAETIQIPMHQ